MEASSVVGTLRNYGVDVDNRIAKYEELESSAYRRAVLEAAEAVSNGTVALTHPLYSHELLQFLNPQYFPVWMKGKLLHACMKIEKALTAT